MAINWWGVPSTIEKLPTYEPNQISAFNQLLQQGMQNYDPTQLEKFATQQFQQQTIPQLAERFTAGVGGKPTSPAFVSQLGEAGAGLASRLAAMRAEQGLQQLRLGLTPQYEYMYRGENPGIIPSAAASLVEQGAQALPSAIRAGFEYLTKPGVKEAAGQVGSSALQALSQGGSDFPAPSAPQVPQAGAPDISALAKTAALAKQFGPQAATAAAPTAVKALQKGIAGKAAQAAPLALPTVAGAAGKTGLGAKLLAGLKAGTAGAVKFVGIPAMLGAQGYGWYQLYKSLRHKHHHHHHHKKGSK